MEKYKSHRSVKSLNNGFYPDPYLTSKKHACDSEFDRNLSHLDFGHAPRDKRNSHIIISKDDKTIEHIKRQKTNDLAKPAVNNHRALSENYCSSCIKHLSLIEKLKKLNIIESEKYLATEMHLKQYDKLLQIKDSQLKQQDVGFKAELEQFEKEKDKLARDQKTLNEEKCKILKEKEYLEQESNKFEIELEELNQKHEELKELIYQVERKREDLVSIQKNSENEMELKNKLLLSKEEKIQSLLSEVQMLKNQSTGISQEKRNLEGKLIEEIKFKYKAKKQKLKDYAKKIHDLKEKFEIDQKNKEKELEAWKLSLKETETKINEEKQAIEVLNVKIYEEKDLINKIKEELKIEQENFDKEVKLYKEKSEIHSYNEKNIPCKFSNASSYCENCSILSEELKKYPKNCTNCEKLQLKLVELTKLNEKIKDLEKFKESSLRLFHESMESVRRDKENCENCLKLRQTIKNLEKPCENCITLQAALRAINKPCLKCSQQRFQIDQSKDYCEKCKVNEDALKKSCQACINYQKTIMAYEQSNAKCPSSPLESTKNYDSNILEYKQKCEILAEQVETLTAKLKIVECSREEYENENFDLTGQIKELKRKKSFLKTKVSELEQIIGMDNNGMKRELTKVTQNLMQSDEKIKEIIKERNSLEQGLRILTLKYEELESQHKEIQQIHAKCLEGSTFNLHSSNDFKLEKR